MKLGARECPFAQKSVQVRSRKRLSFFGRETEIGTEGKALLVFFALRWLS